ncbi:MAG TPA: cation diffusion facilitator family transporter [Nocardioidaceae bacterium]|jgi:cation diffusion facilitator family transporter|nr:cation diffusion facilitator family transporter [Nocardioidaceae bacterium]
MTEQQLAGPLPDGEAQSGGESATTVLIAFAANLAIAVAKTVVAVITGSASMLAESAHSWADTANEVLLLVAERRARREPDESHPFGYGRLAYVWSMFAALGLFTAGAVVSVWHGVSALFATTEETSYFWAYVVLGIAFVLEGISFVQAFRQTRREAATLDRDILEHALATSDPTLRAVFAEDSAALVGLVIAGLGILLHQLTGNPAYDAIGSILVGVLLGVVAVILINRNISFLSGQESDTRLRDSAIGLVKAMPQVARVAYMRLEYVGPRKVLLVAAVDLEGEHPETQVAYMLRDLEHEIEKQPIVTDAVLTLATPEEPSL